MKRTGIVLSMLVFGAIVAQANLIVNGGFEDATTSPWAVSGGLTNISISTASANSGSQSGQLDFSSANGSLRQGIFIDPEDRLLTYTFSFSVNVEATGHSTIFGIRPALGEWNQITSIGYQYGDIKWVQPGTTGWVTYTQDFTLTQADGTYLEPRLYTYPAGVAGSVLVDDISLTAVPEPATMGLFGSLGAIILLIRRRFMI